jgi:hypothetical protein
LSIIAIAIAIAEIPSQHWKQSRIAKIVTVYCEMWKYSAIKSDEWIYTAGIFEPFGKIINSPS